MFWVWYTKSTSTNISQKENDISIDLKKKLKDQLIEIRKYRYQVVQIAMLLLMTSRTILKLTIIILIRKVIR